jgi:hypothetical protein
MQILSQNPRAGIVGQTFRIPNTAVSDFANIER